MVSENIFDAWQGVKHRKQLVDLGFPVSAVRGEGAYVETKDGKRYVDFLMGWGALLYGHADTEILHVAVASMQQGVQSSLHNEEEIALAEMIQKHVAFKVRVAYGLNGSDVATGALRVARRVTNKRKAIFYGYHGWHDWVQFDTPGVSKVSEILSIRCTSIQQCRDALEKDADVAVLFIETPVREDVQENDIQELVAYAQERNIKVVFDDIKSGLRLGVTAGINLYGCDPDMFLLGKAFGGGFPISMLVLKEELNNFASDIQFSATFWAPAYSCAVAKHLIIRTQEDGIADVLDKRGVSFAGRINDICKRNNILVALRGHGALLRFDMNLGDENTRDFLQGCYDRGILFHNKHCFISAAHSEVILEGVIDSINEIVK